jgi:hypothetical protein
MERDFFKLGQDRVNLSDLCDDDAWVKKIIEDLVATIADLPKA